MLKATLAAIGITLCAGPGGRFEARAAEEDGQGVTVSVTDENDAWSNFFGPHQDRHYTHGIKIALMGGDDGMTNSTVWLNRFFGWGHQPRPGNLGFVLGQDMYTPENITNAAPIKTDRPYAGWLYWGLVYQRHREDRPNYAVMENFEVNLGVVGPYSFADSTQKLIHRWRFPEDIPQGWGNQVGNEPGLVLKYAHLWRYSPTAGLANYFDVIPRAGFELGNVAIFATAGATARLGWNLPPDFGAQIIDSPASDNGGMNRQRPAFSCYAFAGADGRYVVHDIALDGNSFRSGPSIEKYNWVNDLSWGLTVQAGRHVALSWTQVTRSKEFYGQQNKDVFGSIDLKFNFLF